MNTRLKNIIQNHIPVMYYLIDNFHWWKKHGIYYFFERRKKDTPFQKICKYNDIHRGEKCYIVLTGPSLRIEDLELIKGEYSISVNSCVKCFEKTDWRPDYLAINDCKVYSVLKDEITYYEKDIKEIFYTENQLGRLEKYVPLFGNINTYLRRYYKNPEKHIHLNKNLYYGIDSSINVAFIALQIAFYMGFNTIVLLGADCDYSNDKKHADFVSYNLENPSYMKRSQEETEKNLFLTYKVAYNEARNRKINVYNSTRGGKLEVFERMCLEDTLRL